MNSPKRELILSALLANPTIRDASEACGVPERTLYTWLRRPDFRTEYDARRGQLVQAAWSGLQARLAEAIGVIAELMQDAATPPQVRLGAARTVLEFSIKAVEQLDILPRLEALEAAQNGTKWQRKDELYCLPTSGG